MKIKHKKYFYLLNLVILLTSCKMESKTFDEFEDNNLKRGYI